MSPSEGSSHSPVSCSPGGDTAVAYSSLGGRVLWNLLDTPLAFLFRKRSEFCLRDTDCCPRRLQSHYDSFILHLVQINTAALLICGKLAQLIAARSKLGEARFSGANSAIQCF